MNTQDLMVAKDDGKTIQVKYKGSKVWVDVKHPRFKDGVKYRVKPEDDINDDGLPSAMFWTAIGFFAGAVITQFVG